ncbi:uncharacterized protein LOC143602288 [Bidens hawaiensis]|uniref:uncharacterized protein LOC143602288 n=1 Tax=Bidens hawaiensis TaxID=980011 RepID=UPI004049BD04
MTKRKTPQISSSSKASHTGDSSNGDMQRTTLSDISNAYVNNVRYANASEAVKFRKVDLHINKSNIVQEMSKSNTPESASSSKAPVNGHASNWDMQRTAISSADVRKLNASEARKSRKLLLDSRRSNIAPNTQKSNKPFSSSINSTSITLGKENVTPNTMITNQSSLQTFHENTKNPTSLGDINSGASTSKNNRFTSLCDTRRVYISSPIMASSNCASTSLTKLSSGKRKLISNSRITNPIPMLDLTSDEEVDVEVLVKGPFKGISTGWNRKKKEGKTTYFLCCGYGKVELPKFKDAPPAYKDLFSNVGPKSKFFLKNIRRYNSMFAFTSMGGKVDSFINRGNAPFVFRISGQNYHSIGSLLPENGSKPKFSQLYIYDTENEVSNRQCLFRMAIDRFQENPHANLKLRLIGRRQQDGRTYNFPSSSEVAALIVGDIGNIEPRDIIVETKTGSLKHISELHPSYVPLQYPLFYIYGDDCYRVDIPHRDFSSLQKSKRPNSTMREFFAYRIQDRPNIFSLPLNGRRLFQQQLVDIYTMIETEILNYIRKKQKVLRCESYENIHNLKNTKNQDMSRVGQRVILPSSFTGGSQYMMQNYLDAMAICRWYGYPDFFITITCNPKWPEVKRFLNSTTINPEDRPDIMCRLFKVKLDAIIKDLKKDEVLGKVQAVVYTVEFQKRGLPHAHICLFMHADHKLPTVDHIDPFISAEIPDKKEDHELYSLVSEFMMHGPCGYDNMNCSCMINRRCSKKFPKKFTPHNSIDSNGYPIYRRRDSGCTVKKSAVELDNRSFVPYNKTLLKRYQAHINVEWCNQAASIKYLFKYINKGPDRATVAVVDADNQDDQDKARDEIREYYDCRYLSACEAAWRIFAFEVHYNPPSVVRLPFHLPGQQQVTYGPDDDIDDVLNKPSVSSSMFSAWMLCNQINDEARNLTYVEFPTKFVWKLEQRKWERRKQGFSIGRIHQVSPSLGEAYFLRILLNKVKGPKSFDDIRTVDGQTYPTFRDACYARGLLDDDMEYIEAIKEASASGSGYYLRALFGSMLLSSSLSRPDFVWEKTWEYLLDDIIYTQQRILNIPDLSLPETQIKNLTLCEIEKYLLRNNSSLRRFQTMPYPDHNSIASSNNRLIVDELSYDTITLQNESHSLISSLTDEQRKVFDEIMNAVKANKGGVFFLYGYGGTGKTFLWKTLSVAIRSKGQIVLNVASSGIASLLLSGGRTAHSRFHIPINLNEDSTCSIKLGSDDVHLLKETKLIIWDEAPMIHKHAFEALDRTMTDVLTPNNSINSGIPFGGKVIVFGGDFRQVLPVITNGSRQQIVNASLCSSYIWGKCKLLRLTKNMRLTIGAQASDIEQTNQFAKWLLDIGEGNVGGSNDGEATIDIPRDLLINDSYDPIQSLIDFVYPSIIQNIKNIEFFRERAILAPTNEDVQDINDRLISLFPRDEKEYLSSDSTCNGQDGGPSIGGDNDDVEAAIMVVVLEKATLVIVEVVVTIAEVCVAGDGWGGYCFHWSLGLVVVVALTVINVFITGSDGEPVRQPVQRFNWSGRSNVGPAGFLETERTAYNRTVSVDRIPVGPIQAAGPVRSGLNNIDCDSGGGDYFGGIGVIVNRRR